MGNAKMRTFLLITTLALVAEAGGKNKNRKDVRKQFRKCKRENCADKCEVRNQREECYTCLEAQCQIPKRVARIHQCVADSCVDNCVDAESEQCKQCRKDNCFRQNRASQRKFAGGAPKQRPLAVLDKFVCGAKQQNCLDIQSGAKAQHRCALGFCYKKCILEPINELDCEDCVRTMCPRASDNYSCVSAEREHKYFFCSSSENCTGNDAGGVPVSNKSCPRNAHCCSWRE